MTRQTMRDLFPNFFRLARNLRPMKVDFTKTRKKEVDDYSEPTPDAIIEDWCALDQANLVTSQTAVGTHRVVLDIDHDAALIPSTTPGHYHLIIDVPVDWEKYTAALRALANAGIIEKGFADVSIAKGYSAVRTPWTRKENPAACKENPAA